MLKGLKSKTRNKPSVIVDQSAKLAAYASQALDLAGQLRLKTKPIEKLKLSKDERSALAMLSEIPVRRETSCRSEKANSR